MCTRAARAAMPLLALCCTIGAAGPGPAQERAPEGEAEALRATMAGIVEALAFVLPVSLSDERFTEPGQRDAILAALDRLAGDGTWLAAHAESEDLGFGFLSRSLAQDAAEIRSRYLAGRPAEARFLLLELTQGCATCHSRLPDAKDHPVGRRLADDPRVAALDAEERVSLEVATRQFERALATYEALFADPARSPASLDLQGHVEGYLEVALRVEDDPERALRTFTALAGRKDLPAGLRENLATWIASLGALRGRSFPGSPVASARALVAEAQDAERFPDDRAALVHYVTASGLLFRFVSANPPRGSEVALASYLLGVIESRIGRAFWLSQTEFYLEQAIRLAPHEPFAKEAYELLEEFLVSGTSGAAGSEVPASVREQLAELEGLIRRAQGG